MAKSELDRSYDLIMQLVEQAGQIIASRNDQRKTVTIKSDDIDLLTETDQEVEKLLMDSLAKEFPNHKFIGEEQSSSGENEKSILTDAPTWIIDPVDGTMNFVHSFPHSCVSVALLVEKRAEIAIVYNPILGQKFTARRGGGCFYNGKPIRVSGQKDLSKSLVTTEFGTSRDAEKMMVVMENLRKVVGAVHGVRTLGAAAMNMSMVALGAADVNYEFGVHAWDIAAGDLLVREAGGVTMDPAGGPLDLMSRRVLAASSAELAQSFVPLLTQYYPLPRDD